MSTHKTYALEDKILNHWRGGTAWTQPTSLTVGLFTAVSDANAGTVTEVSTAGGHYARQTLTLGAPGAGAVGRRSANTAAVTFPQNTSGSSLGTVTHWGIYENNSTLIYIVPFGSSFDYADQLQPEFAIGALTVEHQGETNYMGTAVLNHLRGGTAWSQPGSISMGLFTAVTDAYAGTVTEVATGSGYSRQTVAWGAPANGTNGRVIANTALEGFGQNTGSSLGSVTGWGLHDGTNWLYIFTFGSSWTYGTDIAPEFAIGAITVEER